MGQPHKERLYFVPDDNLPNNTVPAMMVRLFKIAHFPKREVHILAAWVRAFSEKV
jgi:hypothetical protein